jgi:hypothetical protein
VSGVGVTIETIGVYRWPYTARDVEAACDVMYGDRTGEHLLDVRDLLANLVVVELRLSGDLAGWDVGGLAQVEPDRRGPSTQVPYDESWWSDDGAQCFGSAMPSLRPCRVVFFLHWFDESRALIDADGRIMPRAKMNELPDRLRACLRYSPP